MIAYIFLIPFVIGGSLFCVEPQAPDTAALMREVQAHQKKVDEVRENYTYHSSTRTDELDGKGKVKKTIAEEHEIFFVNGRRIARLIQKDGRPLSAEEEKKEQERTRKLTLDFSKKLPAFGNGGAVNLVQLVLAVAEVSNPRPVELNGRPTLAFDFKGNPKAEAHGMESSAARKLAGKVWIDQADRQVARLEVEFYDDFRVGGGLVATVRKGTVIRVDQSPVGEGLWMPTARSQKMNLRVITKNTRENTEIRNFDFKRFNVDAVEQTRPHVAK